MGKTCPKLKVDAVLINDHCAKLTLNKKLRYQEVGIKYIAITGSGSNQATKQKRLRKRLDKNGETRVKLPNNTTAVKFNVCINFNCDDCYYISACIPSDMSVELLQPNLSQRLALENCCRFTVDASGYDHANAKEQLGPCRASRAMAIVHIAMFETYIAINGGYESYLGSVPTPPSNINSAAAIAQAMCDTVVALFPSQTDRTDEQLAFELSNIPNGVAKNNGIAFGSLVANLVLQSRVNDGANTAPVYPETSYAQYISENPPGNTPGLWTKDPISNIPVALGYHWDQVTPFVMSSANQFRCPDFPALTSAEYTAAFDEVKSLGGDGIVTPTMRSEEHTNVGIFWAYDGVPNLCAPPRMYNQLAMSLCIRDGMPTAKLFHLITLLNVALADAGIGSWESKYYYKIWRPVTGVRETHSDGTPAPDGNPNTVVDPTFTPLGAPATNSSGVDFTPPFPAYPSGHATFGGALFQILRRFYGKDDVPFTFVSDELNGTTTDSSGNVRPLAPRSFMTFSQAEEENGKSRIYLGIHWTPDADEGKVMGNQIANLVYDTIYRPL